MAERYEIVIDFSPFAGQKIILTNARDVFKDEDYAETNRVMQFKVGQYPAINKSNNNWPPARITTINWPPVKSGVDRSFKFERKWVSPRMSTILRALANTIS